MNIKFTQYSGVLKYKILCLQLFGAISRLAEAASYLFRLLFELNKKYNTVSYMELF